MIGFLGGSFDPIHYGHLNNARAIKRELNLQSLFLLPCQAPVHKNPLFFSTQSRLTMLKMALEEYPDLSLDTQEITRNTLSYTIDTLKNIKKQYPHQNIYFIMGSDSLNSIKNWKDYSKLSHYAHLVVMPRTSYLFSKYPTQLDIYFAKTPLVDISSTTIRSKIHTHQDLSGLMPQSVINYIKTL
jgi:nicotinate-nucleotide adenylyltransferase